MPVVTEKRTPKVRRHIAVAVAAGMLLLLLSLPFALTLFSRGISVGQHGVHAGWDDGSGVSGTPGRVVAGSGPVRITRIDIQLIGGGGKSYVLTFW